MLKARTQIVYDALDVVQSLYDRDHYTWKQTVDHLWDLVSQDVELDNSFTQYMSGPRFLAHLVRVGLIHEDAGHILEVTNPVESIVKLPSFPLTS